MRRLRCADHQRLSHNSLVRVFNWSAVVVFIVAVIYADTVIIPRRAGRRVVDIQRNGRTLQLRPLLMEMPEGTQLPKVEAFLGIQYASLLGTDLRFMPPTNPTAVWEGNRIALKYGAACPQKLLDLEQMRNKIPRARFDYLSRLQPFTEEQAEDCLNLNIYIPQSETGYRNASNLLPVMVLVHGESFDYGTGNAYDGSVLAAKGNLVVVTLNYRLGALGFLSTGSDLAAGNYALIDLVAALQWLKDNVRSFGGDPGSVTLLGHGYGAALVQMLALSPVTKDWDLFHRIIMMSGSAQAKWAHSHDPAYYNKLLVQRLNCSQVFALKNPIKKQIACFKHRTAEEIVAPDISVPKYLTSFGPVTDGSVLTDTPDRLVRDPSLQFANVDLLIGAVSNEAYQFFDQATVDNGIDEFGEMRVVRTYVQNTFDFHRQKIYDLLMYRYHDWDQPVTPKIRRDKLLELLSDGIYGAPLVKSAMAHASTANRKSTHFYYFDHASGSSTIGAPRWAGTMHGDDLLYVLGAPLVGGVSPFPRVTYPKPDRTVSAAVIRMWSNFARTGNPNLPMPAAERTKFASVYWPPFDTTSQAYLKIGKSPSVEERFMSSRMGLWLDLVPKIHLDDDPNPAQHRLDNANNRSTFDSGTRTDRRGMFIPPPTPPLGPPPYRKDRVVTRSESGDELGPMRSSNPDVDESDPVEPLSVSEVEIQSEPDDSGEKLFGGSLSLSVTIAVGCSLLFLNLLIFAAVYYHRDKVRQERRQRVEKQRQLLLMAASRGDVADSIDDVASLRGGGIIVDQDGSQVISHSRKTYQSKISSTPSSKRSVQSLASAQHNNAHHHHHPADTIQLMPMIGDVDSSECAIHGTGSIRRIAGNGSVPTGVAAANHIVHAPPPSHYHQHSPSQYKQHSPSQYKQHSPSQYKQHSPSHHYPPPHSARTPAGWSSPQYRGEVDRPHTARAVLASPTTFRQLDYNNHQYGSAVVAADDERFDAEGRTSSV